ncbi:4'-phosphopantetheinyl transferase superfamily protein [Actinoplanes sp. NPDC051861]|uniref:4'-phosphopantetheinyl transferase family protein n=1 Tax=Actinoplanes sp. NPDC051861 TaxID=3155170 RepID=UPI0034236E12
MRVDVVSGEAAGLVAASGRHLTTGDHEAARRFSHDGARRLWLASRALQRALGAHLLGVAPEDVVIERRCAHCGDDSHGKPSLPGVDYSVSHSGSLVALAWTTSGRVGLDLEAGQRLGDAAGVAEHLAAEGEIPDLSPEQRQRAVLRLWARKEAVVKLTGHGMTVPLTGIRADRDLVSVEPRPAGWPDAAVWVRDLDLEPGYFAALATSPEIAEVSARRISAPSRIAFRR